MNRMILLLLGRSISKAAPALCRGLFALVPRCALGSVSSAHPKSTWRGSLLRSASPEPKAGVRLSVGGRAAGAPGAAPETRGADGVRSLLSLCLPLEEEAESTSVFQAGSQAGIIFMFPAENRWFLAKRKFSMWKFLFCGNGVSDEKLILMESIQLLYSALELASAVFKSIEESLA